MIEYNRKVKHKRGLKIEKLNKKKHYKIRVVELF
jgi:hypothetical protein